MRLPACTALTVAVLATSACGTGDLVPPDSTPTASADASTGETRPTESPLLGDSSTPDVPPVAREQTEDGALAFVEHYFATMNVLAAQPTPGVLDALAAPSCEPCGAVADAVDTMADRGQTAAGPFVAVEVLDAVMVNRGAGVGIDVQWLRPALQDASGARLSAGPGGEDGLMVLDMTFVGERWFITGIAPGSLP